MGILEPEDSAGKMKQKDHLNWLLDRIYVFWRRLAYGTVDSPLHFGLYATVAKKLEDL